jgi:hypothetical protein
MPDLGWLQRGGLRDEGLHTAVYFYFKLKNILTPEDCRPAVLEETEPLEREFGRPVVERRRVARSFSCLRRELSRNGKTTSQSLCPESRLRFGERRSG